jgi:hypothetical protein
VTDILCSVQSCGWLHPPKAHAQGSHAKAKNCFPANVSAGGIAGEEETQVSGFHLVPGRPPITIFSTLSPPLSSPSSYVGYLTSTASPVRAAVSQLLILQMSERDQVLIFVEEMKTPI